MKTETFLLTILALLAITGIAVFWHYHEQDDGSERFHGPSTWSEGPR